MMTPPLAIPISLVIERVSSRAWRHCHHALSPIILLLIILSFPASSSAADTFLEKHCVACHDGKTKAGNLDLSAVKRDFPQQDNFQLWVKIHDRLAAGEMPPRDQPRPTADELAAFHPPLRTALIAADRARLAHDGAARTRIRRLTRAEYEHTIRDLFDLPGLPLQNDLPADGNAYGYDKNADALDISHVNLAKYLEAADRALDVAIAQQPRPPAVRTQRISLANPPGFVAHVLLHGDGVLLKNKQIDPDFPPAGTHAHLDQGAHERLTSFRNGATVGLFRHEDESFHPYFNEFVAIYPARYRLRISLWSFQWDKGQVLPARGTEAARLSIVQLVGDGRGGGHPSSLLGYFDAPSLDERRHEVITWLNEKETIGFNAASLAQGGQTRGKMHALGFTGPGIACDYLDVEGPLYETWPPNSHRRLFGNLPLVEFQPADHPQTRPPARRPVRQTMHMGKNLPDPFTGIWTVHSDKPREDAERLLADFLPRAFRRPVSPEVRQTYVAQFERRLAAGDCFETALRWAYRAALCSPDFLYHVETGETLDDHALASRLAYFLWNSAPDEALAAAAQSGKLRDPQLLRGEVERLLSDPKSQRFVEDFLGQWLKLRQIAATDPDKKLYPEFNVYLQDSMVAETRAYFRELLDKNLDAAHLVRSNFAMLNEKLAVHYGLDGVSGSQIRRVPLPADSPRGGFLTQGSLLKITANGTTTSPVPRGAFVMARILGVPPDPPPANVPAIEPDVRGAQTIREQLDKHRTDALCASCHVKIDPPGFALESFDVIGGWRSRYRSIGEGDPAPRGRIDPFIGIGFRLGPAVDASGELPDGRKFADIQSYRELIAAQPDRLLANMARQFVIYATGRDVTFSDRDEVEAIVRRTQAQGGGIRTLLHEVTQSGLFRAR